MIVLIGGASCTGKTLLAQRLLERTHLPYLSLDHLKMGWIRGLPGCPFTATDPVETIAAALWPVVQGMLQTAVENCQHLIVEGCYLLPRIVAALPDEVGAETVTCFVGFSQEYLRAHFTDGVIAHRNAIEARGEGEERPLEAFLREHQAFRDECRQFGLPYAEIAEEYEWEMTAVLDDLTAAVEARLAMW